VERKEETKAVKWTLRKAGFDAQVKHGSGTSWGWLFVTIAGTCTANHDTYSGGSSRGDCATCQADYSKHDVILSLVKLATGRKGDYDGQITIRIG
jgi:hypothetical protein